MPVAIAVEPEQEQSRPEDPLPEREHVQGRGHVDRRSRPEVVNTVRRHGLCDRGREVPRDQRPDGRPDQCDTDGDDDARDRPARPVERLVVELEVLAEFDDTGVAEPGHEDGEHEHPEDRSERRGLEEGRRDRCDGEPGDGDDHTTTDGDDPRRVQVRWRVRGVTLNERLREPGSGESLRERHRQQGESEHAEGRWREQPRQQDVRRQDDDPVEDRQQGDPDAAFDRALAERPGRHQRPQQRARVRRHSPHLTAVTRSYQPTTPGE
jgi:hypothetical protein